MNDCRKHRNAALVILASLELTLASLEAAGPEGAAELAEVRRRIRDLADDRPAPP